MEARIRAEVEAKLTAKAEREGAAASATQPQDGPNQEPPVETSAEMEARVRAEVAATHKQIFAACEIAGLSARAVVFIDAGKSLAEVLSELRAIRAAGGARKDQAAPEISTRQPAGGGDASASWDRQIDKINARAAH